MKASILRLIANVLLVASTLAVGSHAADRSPRLGILWPGTVTQYEQAFLQGLRDLGYVEGENILISYRATRGDPARARKLAEELVDLDVDVIFAAVSFEARAADAAARNAARTIPIVFGPVPDPVADGLVASLARPGGTMTGLVLLDQTFLAKQLQVLKESFPYATRVAVIENPQRLSAQYAQAMRNTLDSAAKTLRIFLEPVAMNKAEDIEEGLVRIASRPPDALMVPMSPVAIAARHRIIDFAAKHKLPTMYGDALFVEDGGLMFYGTSFATYLRRAAAYVDRVLKGAKPGDLPVEQPTTFELVVNMKTVRQLNLRVSEGVLLRADRVIE